MADLWSDYTDVLINQIDRSLGDKYKMSINDLLTNAAKYTATPNIALTISNMREEANKYIDSVLNEMPTQVKALEDMVSRASAITGQLSQNISMQTKQHNVPLIKPQSIARDTAKDEVIDINFIDDQLMKLAEKLVEGANLVADFGYSYKNYNIGSWLFDRDEKNYLLNVYLAPNDAFNLELGRQELNDLLDAAAAFVRG
jgi:TPP-dependent trihydroxycyclohexane-1,2-dione (THcHDO) dehydratase